MPLVVWDVVRTVELDPFQLGDDSLHFRIEIQQRADQPVFRTRVLRDATSPTADAALALVLAELQRQFG